MHIKEGRSDGGVHGLLSGHDHFLVVVEHARGHHGPLASWCVHKLDQLNGPAPLDQTWRPPGTCRSASTTSPTVSYNAPLQSPQP